MVKKVLHNNVTVRLLYTWLLLSYGEMKISNIAFPRAFLSTALNIGIRS